MRPTATGKSPLDTVDFYLLDLFTRVVEQGSFSAVAFQHEVAVSSVSRQIKKLEDLLGVALLVKRGATRLVPTEAGLHFYQKAKAILASWSDLRGGLQDTVSTPQGVIRLGCITPVGEKLLTHFLPPFLEANPGIKVDLILDNTYMDVVAERLDLYIYHGSPTGDAMVIRKLCDGRVGIYAASSYLERFGEPTTPEDLAHHNCLVYSNENIAYDKWVYRRRGMTGSVRVSGNLQVNTSQILMSLLVQGVGISMAQSWRVESYVREGRIKRLFPDYDEFLLPFMGEDAIYAIYPQQRALPARTRALLDYLVVRFREADTAR